jgi:carboxymethylenebutenolidase
MARCRAVVISHEYVDVPVGERAMRTFVAAPAAPGDWPGVLFYTDIFQLTDASLRWATRLAGYGFVVAAPEIYHRIEEPGTVLEFDDPGKARGQADVEALTTAEFDEDLAAGVAWLGSRCPAVGAAGHCTGGHLAFRAAFLDDVRGTACWYPTGLHNGKLGQDESDALARAGEIDGELLMIFGVRDPHTPPEARRTVHAALEGRRFTWHEYDAEHAFGRDVGARFDPEATDAAFAATTAFFRRVLR